MPFKLNLTDTVNGQLSDLEHDENKQDLAKLKKVRKCLGHLQSNPGHPGLQSHEYSSMEGENGEKVWEVYVENKTSSAWRVFWHYGRKEPDYSYRNYSPPIVKTLISS